MKIIDDKVDDLAVFIAKYNAFIGKLVARYKAAGDEQRAGHIRLFWFVNVDEVMSKASKTITDPDLKLMINRG